MAGNRRSLGGTFVAVVVTAALLAAAPSRDIDEVYRAPKEVRAGLGPVAGATAVDSSTGRLYVLSDREIIGVDVENRQVVQRIALSGSGRTLAGASAAGKLFVAIANALTTIDAASGKVVRETTFATPPRVLFFDTARERGYAMLGETKSPELLIFTATGEELSRRPLREQCALYPGPDGTLLLASQRSIQIVEPDTWTIRSTWRAPWSSRFYPATYAATTNRILTRTDDALVLLDASTGKILHKQRLRLAPGTSGYNPDEHILLVASRDADDRAHPDRAFVTVFRIESDRFVRLQELTTSGLVQSYRYDARTRAFFGITRWTQRSPASSPATASNLAVFDQRGINGASHTALWVFDRAQ